MNERTGIGTTLCRRHAQQVARYLDDPSGPCEPDRTWLDGDDLAHMCDVVGAPDRVRGYLEHQRGLRDRRNASNAKEGSSSN